MSITLQGRYWLWISLTNECPPKIRIWILASQSKSRSAQGFRSSLALEQTRIELYHEIFSFGIWYLPKADNQRSRACEDERPAEAKYTFSVHYISEPGLTRRHNNHLGARQI